MVVAQGAGLRPQPCLAPGPAYRAKLSTSAPSEASAKPIQTISSEACPRTTSCLARRSAAFGSKAARRPGIGRAGAVKARGTGNTNCDRFKIAVSRFVCMQPG